MKHILLELVHVRVADEQILEFYGLYESKEAAEAEAVKAKCYLGSHSHPAVLVVLPVAGEEPMEKPDDACIAAGSGGSQNALSAKARVSLAF